MELEEAIRTYNLFEDSPKIRQFEEARHFLLEEMKNRKPREEYYKSSNLYDYYILYPYKSLEFSENKIMEVERNYDCIGKGRQSKSERHFCLSLCKMSQNEIIELIENQIKEDNEKYLKEVFEKVEEER